MLRSRGDVVTVASTEGSSSATVARSLAGFGDRLAEHVTARQSQLVLGLDPDPARLWPAALRLAEADDAGSQAPAARAARAVAAHCALALEAIGEQCVA